MVGLYALAILLAQTVPPAAPCEDVVCVEVEKANDAVTFYAVSRADGVTILFSVSAVNMEPASPPPLTLALSRGRTKLTTLKAVRGKKPQFEHGYYWEWGVVGAIHDERAVYDLPFESKRTFRLFQGPMGALTHQGRFAYDFTMPVGTPVRAARAGVVVEVVDQFDEGGPDMKFAEMANRVVILHADGTLGAYLHLLRGGMRVKASDRVEAGDPIASSGNSGFSTGPHLHFEVFRRPEGGGRETLAVKFRTADGDGIVLEEGKSYRAR